MCAIKGNGYRQFDIRLSLEDIKAVEGILNSPGHPAAEVKIEDGGVVVVRLSRKVVRK